MNDPQSGNPYGSPESTPAGGGRPASPFSPTGGYGDAQGAHNGWSVSGGPAVQDQPLPFDRAPSYDGGPYASAAAAGWSLPPGAGIPSSQPAFQPYGAAIPAQQPGQYQELDRLRRGVTWRIVVASIFWVLTGLMFAASLAAVLDQDWTSAGGAYVFGYLLGLVIIVGIPLIVALPLTVSAVRRRRRVRSLEAGYSGWTPMSP